jgi:hypothetical protein
MGSYDKMVVNKIIRAQYVKEFLVIQRFRPPR